MAQRLRDRRSGPGFRGAQPHCSGDVLKWLGLACVCMGTFSTSVLQRGIIHLDSYTAGTLYEVMTPESGLFGYATAAVFLAMFSLLAPPVFAKLLCEGFRHTSDAKKYLLRLLGCAVISEAPFDLVNYGKLFDLSGQNPIWALAAALAMMMILRQYSDRKDALGIALKTLAVTAACAWALLLRSQMGILLVLLAALFYFFSAHRVFCLAAGLLLTLIQFPAPFGMLFVHWYDGGKGKAPRKLFYILYPAQLLAFGIIGLVLAGT